MRFESDATGLVIMDDDSMEAAVRNTRTGARLQSKDLSCSYDLRWALNKTIVIVTHQPRFRRAVERKQGS